jgi:hypothetical protein
MPERDELFEVLHLALNAIDGAVDRWWFPEDDPNVLLATAGLFQAGRLIRSALGLAEGGAVAGVGVLVRSAWEYWLLGTYALVGGHDAFFGLELERYRHQVFLAEAISPDDPRNDQLRAEQTEYQRLASELLKGKQPSATNRDQVAARLGPLIDARFPADEPADVVTTYDLLYRSHSTMDVHPPLTMNQLTTPDGRIDTSKQPWLEPEKAVRVAGVFVVLLAYWIDTCLHGNPDQVWDELTERLAA